MYEINKIFSRLGVAACIITAVLLSGYFTDIDAIDMQIVDAESGSPLEGAIIVYELHTATDHGTNYTQHAIDEAISGKDGWFHIPSQAIDIFAYMNRAPSVIIFKSGYETVYLSQYHSTSSSRRDVLSWSKNGEIVKLVKKTSHKEYSRNVEHFNKRLEWVTQSPDNDICGWTAIPNALRVIDNEFKNGALSLQFDWHRSALSHIKGNLKYYGLCGEITDYLRGNKERSEMRIPQSEAKTLHKR